MKKLTLLIISLFPIVMVMGEIASVAPLSVNREKITGTNFQRDEIPEAVAHSLRRNFGKYISYNYKKVTTGNQLVFKVHIENRDGHFDVEIDIYGAIKKRRRCGNHRDEEDKHDNHRHHHHKCHHEHRKRHHEDDYCKKHDEDD